MIFFNHTKYFIRRMKLEKSKDFSKTYSGTGGYIYMEGRKRVYLGEGRCDCEIFVDIILLSLEY